MDASRSILGLYPNQMLPINHICTSETNLDPQSPSRSPANGNHFTVTQLVYRLSLFFYLFGDSFYPKSVRQRQCPIFWHTSPNLYSKLYKPKRQAKGMTLLKQFLSRTATYVAPVYTWNVIYGANVSWGSHLYTEQCLHSQSQRRDVPACFR